MTYSVVARDPRTGELGVACQSHFFGVGAAVVWAEAGVGTVATQALVEPAYGWRGLASMRDGTGAKEALDAARDADPGAAARQVAMLDARGGLAVHTGAECLPVAGSRIGDGYSVQGNMLVAERVLDAMAAAMEDDGVLADRLVGALQAAERTGGEVRGAQAAAIRIVAGERPEQPWGGTLLDLRVDDALDPVGELTRLVRQQRLATTVVGILFGDGRLFGDGDAVDDAAARLAEVAADDSEVGLEARLWHSVLLSRSAAPEAAAARTELLARRPTLEALLVHLDGSSAR